MKKLSLAISLLLTLSLIAACGGDEVDPNQSEEGQVLTEAVGGPFSAEEFQKFIKDLPSIPGLTSQSQQAMQGQMGGAAFSQKVAKAVTDLGWDEDRFMYIYSHAMTMVSVDQMDAMQARMQAQFASMPEEQKQMMEQMMKEQMGGQMEELKAEAESQVPASEKAIIRDNIDELRAALGIVQP